MSDECLTPNFWVSVVTCLLGTGAFLVYFWQKGDQKKDSARVILVEMRHAQKIVESVKLRPLDLRFFNKLLLGNSWDKHYHLFVSDFDLDELDFITDFYSKCSCVEKALAELNTELQRSKKIEAYFIAIAELARTNPLAESYLQKKEAFDRIYWSDNTVVQLDAPQEALYRLLNGISLITQSPVYLKLKKIAKL